MNVCIFVFKMEMNRMKKELDIITFDADDTLWENELFFRENEHRFCELIKEYADQDQILESLLKNTSYIWLWDQGICSQYDRNGIGTQQQ